MMPVMDGLTCLRSLHEYSALSVILLTTKGEERDRVRGLDLGADACLTTLVGPAALPARVRAVLRRRTQLATAEPTALSVGDLTINLARRRVARQGREVRLTPTEHKLLYALAAHRGRVMVHDELLARA